MPSPPSACSAGCRPCGGRWRPGSREGRAGRVQLALPSPGPPPPWAGLTPPPSPDSPVVVHGNTCARLATHATRGCRGNTGTCSYCSCTTRTSSHTRTASNKLVITCLLGQYRNYCTRPEPRAVILVLPS